MEYVQMALEWVSKNSLWVGLATFVFFQWVAFQLLLVHYHFFRMHLKRPKPDQQRFASIDSRLEFQDRQMDQIFEKMAELKKELREISLAKGNITAQPESMESRFMSLGEMKLKQRLAEIKSKLPTDH